MLSWSLCFKRTSTLPTSSFPGSLDPSLRRPRQYCLPLRGSHLLSQTSACMVYLCIQLFFVRELSLSRYTSCSMELRIQLLCRMNSVGTSCVGNVCSRFNRIIVAPYPLRRRVGCYIDSIMQSLDTLEISPLSRDRHVATHRHRLRFLLN